MLLMKIEREQLLRPLQSVSGIVEKRHTLPILSNVLIETEGDALTLLATDIEIQIRTRSTGSISGAQPAALTVAARKLQDILRALPEGQEVSLDADDCKLTVRAGKSRFTLQTLPAQDYPRMQLADGETVKLSLSQKKLKRLLSLVQYSMAQQDIRYYLNGLLLSVGNEELRLVATDGHRLAYVSEAMPGVTDKLDVILPRKTVLELARQLADIDDPVDIELGSNQARLRFGAVELITKLIDGKFPDYERVIPKDHPKELMLQRSTFLPALQRAAILTNEKFKGVRVVLSAGTLKLISSNAEQEEAVEELEVEYDGDGLDIGFNVSYLLDVLNNVGGDTLSLKLNDGNSSALITLPGTDAFKYVVMPMRV